MTDVQNQPAIQLANTILHAAYRLTGRESALRRDAGAGDIRAVQEGVNEVARRYKEDPTLTGNEFLKPIVEVLGRVKDISDIRGETARALSTLDAPNPETKPVPVNPFATGPSF